MKKINWKYVTILGTFLILATLLLLYKISDQYMWTDEIFSFHAAKRIIETGEPIYEHGLNYSRAPIYHWLLAKSMEYFGQDTFGSRVINIPFLLGTGLISFFFTKDITKKNKNTFWISLTTAFIFLTTNFTIAMSRETRMYSFMIFFFTLAIYAFYKGFISKKSTNKLKLWNFEFRYNLWWILIFLGSFYISYNAQPISVILGLGILVYYLIEFITKHKKESLVMFIGGLLVALLAIYDRYQTLNVVEVFNNLAPNWADEPPILTYYPVLLVRSFTGIAILSPILIFTTIKKNKKIDLYLLSIFSSYLIFMSLQPAQHERYLEPVLPILIIMFVIGMYRLIKMIPKEKYRLKQAVLGLIIVIVGIPHIYLLQKEVQEIDTYTDISISIHKKLEFNKLFEYLNTKDLNNYLLIADYHSAFTLVEEGYDIDYILVSEDREDVKNGATQDLYFGISYVVYGEDFENLIDGKARIIITRDYDNFEDIENNVARYDEFERPRVYR